MRIEEARLIARWASELSLPPGSVCLNVGSSTAEFREQVQPHIQAELVEPLEKAGLRLVHCDLKQANGVDEVGDLLDSRFREHLRAYRARLMICSNLLEHLTDPRAFAAACGELLVPGGYAIVTVPYSYPYHPDPIDTMLRPSPEQLARLLDGWALERSAVVEGGNHWEDLKRSGEPWSRLIRQTARALMPFYRASQWRHVAHRLLWLRKTFTASAVLLRKPGPEEGVQAREPRAASRARNAARVESSAAGK